MGIRKRRRDRGRKRQNWQAVLSRLDAIASEKIRNSLSLSAATWGGTRCPGCGIAVERPHWIAPFSIAWQGGRVFGQGNACQGLGKNFVRCPGENDNWQY